MLCFKEVEIRQNQEKQNMCFMFRAMNYAVVSQLKKKKEKEKHQQNT